MSMIATTINSSIKENPFRRLFICSPASLVSHKIWNRQELSPSRSAKLTSLHVLDEHGHCQTVNKWRTGSSLISSNGIIELGGKYSFNTSPAPWRSLHKWTNAKMWRCDADSLPRFVILRFEKEPKQALLRTCLNMGFQTMRCERMQVLDRPSSISLSQVAKFSE